MKTVKRAAWALTLITATILATSSICYADGGEDGSSLVPLNLLPTLESDILRYVNQYRVDEGGAPAFSESTQADEMAQAFSQTLVKSGYFSSDQPGQTYADRLQQTAPCGDSCGNAAESLFQMDYPSMNAFLAAVPTDEKVDSMAKDIVNTWHMIPLHRHYMEDPTMESIGIGVAVSATGKLYATAEYIRTSPLPGAGPGTGAPDAPDANNPQLQQAQDAAQAVQPMGAADPALTNPQP